MSGGGCRLLVVRKSRISTLTSLLLVKEAIPARGRAYISTFVLVPTLLPPAGLMAPRELMFTGEGDTDEFFYTYEFAEMRGKSDEDKALELPAHLSGEAFKFYREFFTGSDGPTEEGMSFKVVKEKMFEKFASKMTIAEATVEAVNLRYKGQDMSEFLKKADKLYGQAGFTDEAKYGLIRKAVEGDRDLIRFVVLRSARTYGEVKEACVEYAENHGVLGSRPGRSQDVRKVEDKKSDDDIEDLRRQIESMKLMLTKQQRGYGQDRPARAGVVCHKCKKPGHYASQCQLQGGGQMLCTYCRKFGHSENACYTKQRDDEVQGKNAGTRSRQRSPQS